MWKKTALALCFFACLLALLPPVWQGGSPFQLGLDLAGGAMVTYRADFDSVPDRYADVQESELLALSKDVLAGRLAQRFDTLPDVAVRGDGRLVASLPGVQNQAEVLETLGETYRLSFRAVLETSGEAPAAGDLADDWRRHAGRWLHLGPERLDGDMLDPRAIQVDTGHSALNAAARGAGVTFRFRPPFDDDFAQLTRELRGQTLAILLNDQVEWAGVVEDVIDGEGVLRGGYTVEDAASVAALLRSGQLPVDLDVEGLTGVGPSLGQAMAKRGLDALAGSAVVLVALLLLAYGHRPALLGAGLISLTALVTFTLGLIAVFGLTVDLVAIAGLVLSIGMGMDAFILIFEAFETGRLGEARTPGVLVRRAYGWRGEGRTLFHAYATTLLVVAVLFFPDRLASFALFLSLGLAASLLTLGVTRWVLSAWAERGWLGDGGRHGGGPFAPLRRRRPGLLRLRRLYGYGLAVLLLAAAGWLTVSGTWITPGADFSPGTQLFVSMPADEDSVGELTESLGARFPELEIRHQRWQPPAENTVEVGYLVTLEGGQADAAPDPTVLAGLLHDHGVTVHGVHGIDARLSGRRIATSLWALVGSFALLGLYLRRLQPWVDRQLMPVSAAAGSGRGLFGRTVFAVVLDVVTVMVALALLGVPIGMPIVAALLTTVGYSVNDSMVLWSHLSRPSESTDERRSLSDHVDALLSRTVLTSLSTAAPALAILAVDLEPLRGFAWAVLVGTVAGTLSSIFIVAPAMASRFEQTTPSTAPPAQASGFADMSSNA